MQSKKFLDFLKTWGVRDRVSSVGYAQSNGRAELAVKAGKRIIYDNAAPDGSLDTDKIARAVLQYRNTPIQGIGLSPAQLLLHRQLRDCLPAHPIVYKPHKEWVRAGYQREQMLAKRNEKLAIEYNRTAHILSPLNVGDMIVLQNNINKRWDRAGFIIEVLPNRQYKIRMQGSGRVTLRNRRFLKKVHSLFGPSGTVLPRHDCNNSPTLNTTETDTSTTQPTPEPPPQTENLQPPKGPTPKLPRAVARLRDFNKPGCKEMLSPTRALINRNRGEGEINQS